MKSILIVSTSLQEEKNLAQAAFRAGDSKLTIRSTASFGQDAVWWEENRPDVLILNLPDELVLQGYFYDKMSDTLPIDLPVIILCGQISPNLMLLSARFQKIRILKAPVTADNLYRTAMEVDKDYEPGKRQVHPRYLTDQEIEVFSDLKPDRFKAVMKNLSLTGAYLESSEDPLELQKDDIVKIKVEISQRREYIFDAKVVWARKLDTGIYSFGVTFVDETEVFNTLMKSE